MPKFIVKFQNNGYHRESEPMALEEARKLARGWRRQELMGTVEIKQV